MLQRYFVVPTAAALITLLSLLVSPPAQSQGLPGPSFDVTPLPEQGATQQNVESVGYPCEIQEALDHDDLEAPDGDSQPCVPATPAPPVCP